MKKEIGFIVHEPVKSILEEEVRKGVCYSADAAIQMAINLIPKNVAKTLDVEIQVRAGKGKNMIMVAIKRIKMEDLC